MEGDDAAAVVSDEVLVVHKKKVRLGRNLNTQRWGTEGVCVGGCRLDR